MTDHEKGYRAAQTGSMAREMADHDSGRKRITDRSDDWFYGYQDALDDIKMNNPPMYKRA
jgi:hypothetical protein